MLRLLYIHDTWVNWQRNPRSPVLDLVPTTVFIVIKSQLLNVSKLKKGIPCKFCKAFSPQIRRLTRRCVKAVSKITCNKKGGSGM